MALRRAQRSRPTKTLRMELMRNQNVTHPLLILSLACFQLRDGSSSKLGYKTGRFLCRGYKRIEIFSVPFRHRTIRLDIMRLPQIEEQRLVPRRNNFITPVPRFCFPTNVAPEDSQRVAMIAIAGNYLPSCVATGKEDCNN